MDLEHYSPLGALGRVTRTPDGIIAELGEERFRARLLRPDLVELSISRGGRFDERPTYASAFLTPPAPPFELEDSAERLVLATERVRLTFEKREFHLDAHRSDGTPLVESARDARGRSQSYLVLNDAFVVTRRASPRDAFFGLGQKTGRFDRAGRRLLAWNVDVLSPGVLRRNRLDVPVPDESGASASFDPYYTNVPFFYHARHAAERLSMAGFFIDNGWSAEFDFTRTDALSYRFAGGQYTEYLFAGPEMRSILEGYTFVTGRPALLPRWSLGHQQCRWHDYTDEELLALGAEYRKRDIPCDALWLDIGYMDGYRVFSFHPERYSEPERTFDALAQAGFRVVTIVDPGVKIESGFAVFDSGRAQGVFCKTQAGEIYEGRVWPGRTAFPDFTLERTRAFWAELVSGLAARGVAGIWNDMNEPATGAIEPFGMRFDRDGENDPHERWHNQYALLMALATHAGLSAARPGERPFILSRAGSAGIQRVAAQWLGDHSASFEHLAMGISMALGMGVSGQPAVGGDVPGFAGVASAELAARWFSYAALTPFCRCHHERGSGGHYPWSFGPEVERIARAALLQRYRLLPYLYAASVAATETGEPVQRPMVFEFQDERALAANDDQYLLGEALLVAPIVCAGQTSRTVYLPRGSWVEWHSNTTHEGPTSVSVDAPLDTIPLFARGGSVIPLYESAPRTTRGPEPDTVELHVFVPTSDGSRTSVLYEDDGLSFGCRDGAFLRTDLELGRVGNELSLRAEPSGRGYPEFRRQRLAVVFRNASPRTVTLDGASVACEGGRVTFQNAGEGFELRAELAE